LFLGSPFRGEHHMPNASAGPKVHSKSAPEKPGAPAAPSLDLASVHPVAKVFPPMSSDEFDDLVESIRTTGLVDPIVVTVDGEILEGRHRARACKKLGIEPRVTTYEGDDPVAFVIAKNLARRNLTPGQRACIALLLAESEISGPRGPLGEGRKRDRVAAISGASGRSVDRVRRIRTQDKRCFDRILCGFTTPGEAEKELQQMVTRIAAKHQERHAPPGTTPVSCPGSSVSNRSDEQPPARKVKSLPERPHDEPTSRPTSRHAEAVPSSDLRSALRRFVDTVPKGWGLIDVRGELIFEFDHDERLVLNGTVVAELFFPGTEDTTATG
jgi:ParB-like nuclease domain